LEGDVAGLFHDTVSAFSGEAQENTNTFTVKIARIHAEFRDISGILE
jgi:hypothetical protein